MSGLSVVSDFVKPMLDAVVTGSSAPGEILRKLDEYGIDWYLTDQGDLMIRYWQVGAEGLVVPERVAAVRTGRVVPREASSLEWVSRHLDELRTRYPDRWIAVVDVQVVASATTLPELLQQTEREGVQQPFVTQIPAGGTTWTMTYARQVV